MQVDNLQPMRSLIKSLLGDMHTDRWSFETPLALCCKYAVCSDVVVCGNVVPLSFAARKTQEPLISRMWSAVYTPVPVCGVGLHHCESVTSGRPLYLYFSPIDLYTANLVSASRTAWTCALWTNARAYTHRGERERGGDTDIWTFAL